MRIEWRRLVGKGRSSRVVRAGRWTLIVIVSALALIGFLHLTRGTAVRHVRGVGVGRIAIAVSEPEFPLSVTMLTGAWLASGNRVEVALNGGGTYARLWDDLRSAQESITLQLYYGHTDVSTPDAPHHSRAMCTAIGLSTFQPGRVILDWPNDVIALADHLQLVSFAVIGYSGGGPCAAACALRIPGRVTEQAREGDLADFATAVTLVDRALGSLLRGPHEPPSSARTRSETDAPRHGDRAHGPPGRSGPFGEFGGPRRMVPP